MACVLWSIGLLAAAAAGSSQEAMLRVSVVTDQAQAVLQMPDRIAAGQGLAESDWSGLFQSEGHVRLKKRQEAFNRPRMLQEER